MLVILICCVPRTLFKHSVFYLFIYSRLYKVFTLSCTHLLFPVIFRQFLSLSLSLSLSFQFPPFSMSHFFQHSTNSIHPSSFWSAFTLISSYRIPFHNLFWQYILSHLLYKSIHVNCLTTISFIRRILFILPYHNCYARYLSFM